MKLELSWSCYFGSGGMVFALLAGLARMQGLTYGNGTDEVRCPCPARSSHFDTLKPSVSSYIHVLPWQLREALSLIGPTMARRGAPAWPYPNAER